MRTDIHLPTMNIAASSLASRSTRISPIYFFLYLQSEFCSPEEVCVLHKIAISRFSLISNLISASVRFASIKFAPLNFVHSSFAFRKSAPKKSAFRRSAPFKFVPFKLARLSFAYCKSDPLKLAPRKSAPFKCSTQICTHYLPI